jgi:hypothetical protein
VKKIKNVLKLIFFWRSERKGREGESDFQTGLTFLSNFVIHVQAMVALSADGPCHVNVILSKNNFFTILIQF